MDLLGLANLHKDTMKIDTEFLTCSSCFVYQPRFTYVDFLVNWQGPLVARKTADGLDIDPLHIDELVLCENCIAEAGALIGLVKVDDVKRIEELEEEVLALRRERIEQERRLDLVQDAFDGRRKTQRKTTKAKA